VSVTDTDTGLSYLVTSTGSDISYELTGTTYPLASGPDLWWNIHRTYRCDTGVILNTSDALDIANVVSGSASQSGNLISYGEYDPLTGIVSPRSGSLPQIPGCASCEMACKVQKNATNTQAGLEANTWDYQNSIADVQIIYKSCGANLLCPLDTGETLIQDCACLDEFANAVSHMQVLEDAVNDMICAP